MIDRVATQVLYAVTGIVLARELSLEDFGLVGALLIFQAFASLLVDSGFAYALIQRKHPCKLDYSTVLWFNLAVAAMLYAVLFVCAPLIADCFQGDMRLVPLSRVMFLSLILNASVIVQTNRLMKAMDVRLVAASNSVGLIIGGVVGIVLAIGGYGAWSIVWQTIVLAAGKSIVLWTCTRWRPLYRFSWEALKSYFGIGSRMMFTSFLNTVFLNIYGFFIGHFVGIGSLGYYTQSDKWSKMGISSISQALTSAFLPALSAVQDSPDRFRAMVSKINRFTSYIVFPAMFGLMAMSKPIFHSLFGTKWDPSIILFQLLLLRGVFMIYNSLYNNYLLALGHGGRIVMLEVVRDVAAIIALGATFPFMAISLAEDPVYGVKIMLYGQLAATFVTWVVSFVVVVRLTGLGPLRFVKDMIPYLMQTLVILPVILVAAMPFDTAWVKLTVMIVCSLSLYVGGNYILRSKIQREVFAYIIGKNTI